MVHLLQPGVNVDWVNRTSGRLIQFISSRSTLYVPTAKVMIFACKIFQNIHPGCCPGTETCVPKYILILGLNAPQNLCIIGNSENRGSRTSVLKKKRILFDKLILESILVFLFTEVVQSLSIYLVLYLTLSAKSIGKRE